MYPKRIYNSLVTLNKIQQFFSENSINENRANKIIIQAWLGSIILEHDDWKLHLWFLKTEQKN